MKKLLWIACLAALLCALVSCMQASETDASQNAEKDSTDKEQTAVEDTEPSENERKVVSASIATEPQRKHYYRGDSLDFTGMTLELTYDNGEKITVSEGYTCAQDGGYGGKENGIEEYTVQVSYNDIAAGEFAVLRIGGVELVSSDFLADKTEDKGALLGKDSYYVVFDAEEFAEDTLILPAFYQGVAVKSVYTLENDNVKKLILDEGFEMLPVRAIQHCEMLEEIVLPASVSQIEPNAVFACPNLKKWAVDAKSPHFVSDERGIVYSKDMTVLVTGPKFVGGVGTLAIPEGVTKIAPGAFSYASYIGTLILPKTLAEIGEYAFSDNKGLNVAVIPESVTTVGKNAFAFGSNVYPEEIHCQAGKKPDGWASDWINSKASLAVNWNSRYVDWETLTVK